MKNHNTVQGLRYTKQGAVLTSPPGFHRELSEAPSIRTSSLASEVTAPVASGRKNEKDIRGKRETANAPRDGEGDDSSSCAAQAAQPGFVNVAFEGETDWRREPPTISASPVRGQPETVENGNTVSSAPFRRQQIVQNNFEIIIDSPSRPEDRQLTEERKIKQSSLKAGSRTSVSGSQEAYAPGQEKDCGEKPTRTVTVSINDVHSKDTSPSKAEAGDPRRGSSVSAVVVCSGVHRHGGAGSTDNFSPGNPSLASTAPATDGGERCVEEEDGRGCVEEEDGRGCVEEEDGRGCVEEEDGRGCDAASPGTRGHVAARGGETSLGRNGGFHGYDNQGLQTEEEESKTVVTPKSRKSMALPSPSVGSRTSRTVLVLAALVAQTMMLSFVYGMPTLLLDLMEDFQASRAQAGFIQSAQFFCSGAFGLVFSVLCEKFGCGWTLGVSSVLVCVAAVGCSFSSSYATFMVALSLASVSTSGAFIGPMIILGRVFGAGGGAAISIAALGPGVASVLFPWLGLVLSQAYSWRGYFMVVGALYLHCLPVALFFHLHFELPLNSQMPHYSSGRRPSMLVQGRTLVRDAQYWGLLICIFATMVALPITIFFFTDIAAEKGVDKENASYFISLFGLASLASRAAVAVIKNFVSFQSIRVYVLLLLLCGGLVLVLPWLSGYTPLLVLMVVFGLCYGANMVSFPAAFLETCGENLSVGIGGSGILTAVGALAASPLAGALKDLTGDYDIMLYCVVAIVLSAGCLLSLILLRRGCCRHRDKEGED